ncbi:MAG TPA: hypothetical protein VML58_08330 [Burkholderiaceae bacterium]|nr:hypothetical protein [Burkholderiaceae bacterium]
MRSILCVPLLLVGCAAEPTDPARPEQVANDMVCTREYPTGSSIPMTKCRSSEQLERERRMGQETIRRNTTGTAATKPGGGSN